MLRVLLLAFALTSQCTWPADAADVDWLCYTGPKEPGDPAIRCLPAGGSVVAPLAGWHGARTRDAARTVDVTNRLGRVSVRVRGSRAPLPRARRRRCDGARLPLGARAQGRAQAHAPRAHRRAGRARGEGGAAEATVRPDRRIAATASLLSHRERRAHAPRVEGTRREAEAIRRPRGTVRADDARELTSHRRPGRPDASGRPDGSTERPPRNGRRRSSAAVHRGRQDRRSCGREFVIQGVNWFGFETSNYVPHGLWSRDYRDRCSTRSRARLQHDPAAVLDQIFERGATRTASTPTTRTRTCGADRARGDGQDRRLRGRQRPAGHPRPPSPRLRRAVGALVHRPVPEKRLDRRLASAGARATGQPDGHRRRPAQRAARPGHLGLRRHGHRLAARRRAGRQRRPRASNPNC